MIPNLGPAQIIGIALLVLGAAAVLVAIYLGKRNPASTANGRFILYGAVLCLAGALIGWFA